MKLRRVLSGLIPTMFALFFLIPIIFQAKNRATPVFAYSGNHALMFNGVITDTVQERVQIGNNDGFVDKIMGSDWRNTKSISVWVRPLGPSPSGSSLVRLQHIVTSESKWFGITRGNYTGTGGGDGIYVHHFDGTEDFVKIPYTLGEWVHITFVHSNGILYGYKNGVLVGSVPSGANPGPPNLYFAIGSSATGNGDTHIPFVGQIDEVGLWSTGLTQTTIRKWVYREIDNNHPNWANLGAYYKMSDGTGIILSDDSANTYNGVFYNTPEWVHSGAFAGPRNSLEFDGLDDYVTIPDDTSLDLTSSLTFEAWVKPANWSNGSTTPLIVKGDGSLPQINYYFGKTISGSMVFSYYNGGRIDIADTSGVSFTSGNWYHLAYVVDLAENKVRFYRNGSLLSEVAHDFITTPLLVNDQSLYLASYQNSTDGIFQGQVDEVRLWENVRTQNEIRLNMFQAIKGNEIGLAAYYRFDQDNSSNQNILFDTTANDNDGTLINMSVASDWVASDAFNTWIGSDSTNWSASGNWSKYGIPGATDNVGVYSDTGANTASITTTVSIGNLVVGTGALLSVDSTGSVSVFDSIFNFGTMRQTRPASGSSDIAFLNIGNYGGVALNPNGTDLGNATVTIQGNQQCTSTIGDTVTRCFDITSENPPASGAQIAFYFWDSEDPNNDCTHTEAFHWNGAGWNLLTRDTTTAPWVNGRICGSMLQSIRVEGVTSFSPFALDNTSPTAVTLLEFSGSNRTSDMAFFLSGSLLLMVALLLWLRFRFVRLAG